MLFWWFLSFSSFRFIFVSQAFCREVPLKRKDVMQLPIWLRKSDEACVLRNILFNPHVGSGSAWRCWDIYFLFLSLFSLSHSFFLSFLSLFLPCFGSLSFFSLHFILFCVSFLFYRLFFFSLFALLLFFSLLYYILYYFFLFFPLFHFVTYSFLSFFWSAYLVLLPLLPSF